MKIEVNKLVKITEYCDLHEITIIDFNELMFSIESNSKLILRIKRCLFLRFLKKLNLKYEII